MKFKKMCNLQKNKWYKKIIYKGLSFFILFSNISLDSFAGVISEDGRYETFQGNYLLINDVNGNKDIDIEIEGNSLVNLANIESNFKAIDDFWYKDFTICKTSDLKLNKVYTIMIYKELANGYDDTNFNIFELGLSNNLNITNDHPVMSIELDKLKEEKYNLKYDNRLKYEVIKAKVIFKDFKGYKYLSVRPCRRYSEPVKGESVNYNIKINLLEGDYTNLNIPYFRGMVSTGDTIDNNSLSIYQTNKNLINDTIIFERNKAVNEFGEDYTLPNYGLSNYIQVEGGQTYSYKNTQGYIYGVKIIQYDSNFKYLGQNFIDSGVIKLKDSTRYIRINLYIPHTSVEDFMTYGQLEKSSKHTDYTKGVYSITNINLKEPLRSINDTKDVLKKIKNEWYIERKCSEVKFDGSDDEGWILNTSHDKIFEDYIVFHQLIGRKNAISDKFPVDLISNAPYEHIRVTDSYTFIYIEKSRLESLDLNGFKKWLSQNPINLVYELNESVYEKVDFNYKVLESEDLLNINGESLIPVNIKATVDRVVNNAISSTEEAISTPTSYNISSARMWVNQMPESSLKDEMQMRLSNISNISDIQLDRKSATSNLDVYIKSENVLQMSLDTNSISFEDFSGIEDVEKLNAVNITINSSLPYQLNAYLVTEIQNNDKTKTMDKEILQLKENSEPDYQYFPNINEKMILKDNCPSGNDLSHSVDILLKGGLAYEKDVYKATIKLEAEQK